MGQRSLKVGETGAIRKLEMWVKGHSRSLKVVPFESLDTVRVRKQG